MLQRFGVYFAVLAVGLCASTSARGEGETNGGNGLEPVLTVRSITAGKIGVVTISNLAPSARRVFLSFTETFSGEPAPQFGPTAKFIPDVEYVGGSQPFRPARQVGSSGADRFFAKKVPPRFAGRTFYMQAYVEDAGAEAGGYAFSNGIELQVASAASSGPELTRTGYLDRAFDAATAVYDDDSGVAYVFGGRDDLGYLDQVVRFDIGKPVGERIERLGVRLPSPRSQASSVWDSEAGVAYVFGGIDGFLPRLDEIVVFKPDGANGPSVSVLPSDRLPFYHGSASSAWDPVERVAYLFAGNNSDGRIVAFRPDAPAGQRVSILASDRFPGSLVLSTATWNPVDRVAYIFGGTNFSRTDEVWEFDPSRPVGQRLTILPDRLPSDRARSTAVWDSHRGVAMVYGGDTLDSEREIVVFDPDRSAGSRVSTHPLQLQERADASAAAYDSLRDCTFLFAGINSVIGERSDAVWLVVPDEGVNTKVDRQPEARTQPAVALDPDSGTLYTFGGFENGPLDDVLAQGIRPSGDPDNALLVDRLPSPRSRSTAFWATTNDRAYIFGGQFGIFPDLDEIVEFNPSASAGSRIRRLSTRLPVNLASAVSFFDETTGRGYVLGGSDSAGRIYRFNPANGGLEVLPDSLGTSLYNPTLAWDGAAGVAYIFGGLENGFQPSRAIFEFRPRNGAGNRLRLTADRLPSERFSSAAYWSPQERAAYVVGGADSDSDRQVVVFRTDFPEGQRVFIDGWLERSLRAFRVVFDPVQRLPLFVGGTDSAGQGSDAAWVLRWEP